MVNNINKKIIRVLHTYSECEKRAKINASGLKRRLIDREYIFINMQHALFVLHIHFDWPIHFPTIIQLVGKCQRVLVVVVKFPLHA